ncbi:Gfo/Idh/MocA family oxidoreductase [bacterium]|nr:Gfo/Idh/MocA family oxidoreductase [bacterium]
MSDTLRAGILGLGNISNAHVQGYKKTEGVELVAGADVNQEAVQAAEAKHGIKGYADWRQMLDEAELDVVSICTPPFLHREMAVEALSKGIHVLCEKPIAATLEDAEIMAAAAKEYPAKLMIAYCHRWHPVMLKVKQLIDAGILGKPLFFRCAFAGWAKFSTNHRAIKSQAGGGALMDNGSHATDIYQFLLGKIRNVSCRAGTLVQDIETDDVAIMIFEGENGCYGEVIVGYSLPGDHTEFKIIGEKGVIRVDNYWSGPVRFQPAGAQEWLEHEVPAGDRFQGEFAHFIAAVKGETELSSTAETALHVERVITAAYADAEKKGIAIC